ncbi:hypothetical protein Nm8I071_08130 [Nonomuraea sp. TT08I-71]|nr:hypothetical protein Nm8I071_08130 [Nonomuraea sp. TT08I-71]
MTIVDTPERRQLRELTRAFVTKEVLPYLDDWERAGEVPRSLHETAAKIGLLGIGFPRRSAAGGGDLLDSILVTEEVIRSGGSSGLIAALFNPRHRAGRTWSPPATTVSSRDMCGSDAGRHD